MALISTLGLNPGSSSPGVVVANTHSVGASLIVWLLSGLLGWTGASSFAELGSAIPLNGGAQAYLAYAYGPLVSYLFAWTAIAALKPGMSSVPTAFLFDNLFEPVGAGSNAVISLIFAEYLNRLFWHATKSDVAPDAIPQWAIQMSVPLVITPCLRSNDTTTISQNCHRLCHCRNSCLCRHTQLGYSNGCSIYDCEGS